MSSLGTTGQGRTGAADPRVWSGPAPVAARSYFPRPETGGPFHDVLPAGQTIVLAPGDPAIAAIGPAGLGGTGKTTLAAAIAADYASRGLADLALWIDASSRDAVVSGYAQAVRDLGIQVTSRPGTGAVAEQAAAQFLAWLARTGQPWLIVLDDVRTAAALDGLWPAGPAGRVLVTTNLPETAAAAPNPRLEPIGAFSPREAITFLSSSVQDDSERRVGAIDLAADLGYLPLALGHAAACMAATGLGCRQYHARFTEHKMRLDDGTPPDNVSIAAVTLSVSAELAERFGPPGLTGPALALISALSPYGIPGTLLTSEAACAFLASQPSTPLASQPSTPLAGQQGAPPVDPLRVRAAVTSLARTGLVWLDLAAAGTVRTHPMVQAAVWRSLAAPARERAIRAAADALAQIWPADNQPADLDRVLRRCVAELEQVAGPALWRPHWHPVLLLTGRSLTQAGMPDLAASHWRAMLEVSGRAAVVPPAQVLEILDLLGGCYEASGQPGEAIAAYQRALADRERALAGYHPDILTTKLSLSRAYAAAGRSEEAIKLAQAVISDSEFSLGLSQPSTLAARLGLARAYLSAVRFSDGVSELRQVYDSQLLALGMDHPDTVAVGAELAAAYQAAGEPGQAVALLREALAEAERQLGPRSPNALTARVAVASALRQAGKNKEAVRLYASAVADLERQRGPSHPETLGARDGLAQAYLAVGKLAYAIRELERVVTDSERAFGPEHARTQAARASLHAAAAHAQALRGIDLRSAR